MTDKQQRLDAIKSKIDAALEGVRGKTDQEERSRIVFEIFTSENTTRPLKKGWFPPRDENDHLLIVKALAVMGTAVSDDRTLQDMILTSHTGRFWLILQAYFQNETDLDEFFSLFDLKALYIQKLPIQEEEDRFINSMLKKIGLSITQKDLDNLCRKFWKRDLSTGLPLLDDMISLPAHFFINLAKVIVPDNISNTIETITESGNEAFMKDKTLFMAQVLLGIAIIGGYLYFRHYRTSSSSTSEPPQDMPQNDPARTPTPAPAMPPKPKPMPAVLMLVLEANRLGNAQEGDALSSDAALQFVDAATFFGCFSKDDAVQLESGITGMTNDEFSRESAQHVYVSLSVENGQNLIQSVGKFGLKKNMRNAPERTYAISKMRRLISFDGTEVLTRI